MLNNNNRTCRLKLRRGDVADILIMIASHYDAGEKWRILHEDVLCNFLRGRVDGDTLANIAEEIADVGIMLDQMAIEFEVEDAVAEQRAFKVRRLRSRLECVEQEG